MYEISTFKFFCQKVLPLVYDDSLSYYEAVCKIVDKLNEVVNATNEQSKDIEAFKTAAEETLKEAKEAADEAAGLVDKASDATAQAVTAAENANASARLADEATSNANTATDTANAAASSANEAASRAETAVTTANEALSKANEAISLSEFNNEAATQAVETADQALTNSNTAISNANTAATNANRAASAADTATENANNASDSANAAATHAIESSAKAEITYIDFRLNASTKTVTFVTEDYWNKITTDYALNKPIVLRRLSGSLTGTHYYWYAPLHYVNNSSSRKFFTFMEEPGSGQYYYEVYSNKVNVNNLEILTADDRLTYSNDVLMYGNTIYDSVMQPLSLTKLNVAVNKSGTKLNEDGEEETASGYFCTDFIPVNRQTNYLYATSRNSTANTHYQVFWYDDAKEMTYTTQMSGSRIDISTNQHDATYIRISYQGDWNIWATYNFTYYNELAAGESAEKILVPAKTLMYIHPNAISANAGKGNNNIAKSIGYNTFTFYQQRDGSVVIGGTGTIDDIISAASSSVQNTFAHVVRVDSQSSGSFILNLSYCNSSARRVLFTGAVVTTTDDIDNPYEKSTFVLDINGSTISLRTV